MLRKLLFAGGAAWLYRRFMGGSRRSGSYGTGIGRRGLRW